MSTKV